MGTVPTIEPATVRAGDFITWLKTLTDYPANAGWTLAYTLINATSKITINATASGADHLVSVAATATAAYNAGTYQWMARVTKGTEIYTVGSGSMTVQPNLAVLNTFDGRSHAKKMLEAIEAAFEGRASSTQLEYSISGRSIRYMGPDELIKWRSVYAAEVAREASAASLARTGINRNKIGVRCVRV